MCGIAGVVGLNDSTVATATVQKMISTLARRGPDSEGSEWWPGVVMGHRRLAIFDLSDAGRQPMLTPDRALGVVFNGAIYNYRDLRDELVSRGYSFVSHTDTEVLLHGYIEWGVDRMVSRLRGMFAFALWDERARKLYLVRDRLGVKPLVFTAKGHVIAFASTVRALRTAGYAGDLDEEGVNSFLEFGFVADNRCIYRDITKVPAASIVEWSEGKVSTRKYWTRPSDSGLQNISFQDAVAETKEILLDAVKVRLHADVPVGALLSGGIDSSLVCWAVQKLGGDVRAYTVGTPGDPWDEAAAAKGTAKRLRLEHSIVEMFEDDIPAIDELVSAYAEPFGSSSALGMLRVCRSISRSSPVKVLLTGDGGDDVFLGYPRHRNLWVASKLALNLPAPTMRWLARSRSWVPRVGPLRRAAALLQYSTGGLDGVIEYSRSLQRGEIADLLGDRLKSICTAPNRECSIQSGHRVLSDFVEYEFNTRFVGEYMTKVDGATMHYGIEARSPFLDHRLWEFAASIPFDTRLYRGRLKAVLRRLVQEEIGRGVSRRPKRGFGIPVQRWIVRNWRPWVEPLLRESVLEKEGWIRPGSALEQLTGAVRAGSAPLHLWYVITLEAWIRYERRIGSMS
jgi:asparagine synthase (glutamine-hydrolysing)